MSDSIVVVGGAGHMGSCAVKALVEQGHDVLVADLRPTSVEGARFASADASDQAAIERVAAGAGLIMNFAGPYYVLGDSVARAAIALGVPYVDICDDAEATEALLELDEEAKAAGIPVVLGAGYSPGVLNGLAVQTAAGFETVDQLITNWVVGEKGPTGSAPIRHYFYGITEDIPIWKDGARQVVPAFTAESAEEFSFAEPVGSYVVRDVGHPETVTLPRAVEAREVRNKGALLPPQSTDIYDILRRLGLLGGDSVEINGVEVVARDFVAELLTARHNARATDGSGDVMALGVRVVGVVDGRPTERCSTTAAYMTMGEATALPTAAAVPQLLAGAVPAGANGPEVLEIDQWFEELGRLAPGAYSEAEVWEDDGPRTTVPFVEIGTQTNLGNLIDTHS